MGVAWPSLQQVGPLFGGVTGRAVNVVVTAVSRGPHLRWHRFSPGLSWGNKAVAAGHAWYDSTGPDRAPDRVLMPAVLLAAAPCRAERLRSLTYFGIK